MKNTQVEKIERYCIRIDGNVVIRLWITQREALKLGTAFLKERFNVSEIYTGVLPENKVAKNLYRSFGFENTGLTEFGMEEMRMVLH